MRFSRECSRHSFSGSASPIPWFFVRFDLQAVIELVEAREQVDHGHDLEDCLIIQPELPHRGSVD